MTAGAEWCFQGNRAAHVRGTTSRGVFPVEMREGTWRTAPRLPLSTVMCWDTVKTVVETASASTWDSCTLCPLTETEAESLWPLRGTRLPCHTGEEAEAPVDKYQCWDWS